MRSIFLALAVSAALVVPAPGRDQRHFEDAALHAVQFIDADEGWAVGDEGAVWHTVDGGSHWERQPTGVRASLRSLHFLNPFTGWVAGREELAHGAGSGGVLLFTQDGGLTWLRAGWNNFPGLNRVRFLDNKTGFVAGDGTEQFPGGVFATVDSGRTWKPVAGINGPGWLAAEFQDAQTGVLAGAWGRTATLRQGQLNPVEVNLPPGRSLADLHVVGNRAVAVGQGGTILVSDTAGARWTTVDPNFPTSLRASWDFHAFHGVGEHIWVVGRPGSAVLHSSDRGQNWEVLRTGQPLPLNGVFFRDEHHGWAVGELGSILATMDGGKTWRVQRRGGQRAAVLFVQARSTGLPLDTIALLGGQEGYLAVAVRVNAPEGTSAAAGLAHEGQRLVTGLRQAGGAAGEMLWQFPVPQHLEAASKADLVHSWDRLYADRASEEMLRQMVLSLRVWRPDVVITPAPDEKAGGSAAEALVAEAVREAFTRAADPAAFPEQLETLGLETWKAGKLYGQWPDRKGAQVVLDLNEISPRLEATFRDYASSCAGLLAGSPQALPAQRYYRLLASGMEGAANHQDLMQGTTLAPGGTARRALEGVEEPAPEMLNAIRKRRNFEAMVEAPLSPLNNPEKLLGQIEPTVKDLPDDQAAATVFAVANQYARLGQWTLAREVFLFLVDRYPAHPLAADAYRWLIRYTSSSEARRRQELGQFMVVGHLDFHQSESAEKTLSGEVGSKAKATIHGETEEVRDRRLALLGNREETRKWNQGSLEMGSRLESLGPLFAADPSLQFCLQAARRNLGQFQEAQDWYTHFKTEHGEGPWRDAAAAELWLINRTGPPPKPVASCRQTAQCPFLDGQLDDPCWQGLKPMRLQNAVGDTDKDYPTEAWVAYDQDFLYLALRCRHPADKYVPPVKTRPRDADLRPFDRVSLLLDLDRDYSTCFHLQVDQRGCVGEDCWGDRTWNPRWFVAVHSEPTVWQIEAAIPLMELTGEPITVGRAWACNVVRVLPGRGVQAWSLPADVQPMPEGMGLLMFTGDAAEAGKPNLQVKNQKEKTPIGKDFHGN